MKNRKKHKDRELRTSVIARTKDEAISQKKEFFVLGKRPLFLHALIYCCLILFFPAAAFSQYGGGTADGYGMNRDDWGPPPCGTIPVFIGLGGIADGSVANKNDGYVSCTLPGIFNIGNGGIADGHGVGKGVNIICPALPTAFNIGRGGISDGHSRYTITYISCVTPASSTNAAYSGGIADGHSTSKNDSYLSCSVPSFFSVNLGGIADGHAQTQSIRVVCPVPPPAIFEVNRGGIADGHSRTVSERVFCPVPPTAVFPVNRGGIADGHAMVATRCLQPLPLPIELLSFTARLTIYNTVLCQWVTAIEINNDYFTVEKTKDAKNFESVGRVKGAGNSNMMLSYQLIDPDPYQGVSYYRLKQTDFNGAYTYSQLVPINLNGVEIISIFPNPAHDEFQYEIGSTEKMTLQVRVINVLGQIVINKTENIEVGISYHTLNVSELSSAPYLLQVITENKEVKSKQFQIR